MNQKELEELKICYQQIEQGISTPQLINKIYDKIKTINYDVPERQKIVAINRYYLINWSEAMKEQLPTVVEQELITPQSNVELIEYMENALEQYDKTQTTLEQKNKRGRKPKE